MAENLYLCIVNHERQTVSGKPMEIAAKQQLKSTTNKLWQDQMYQ